MSASLKLLVGVTFLGWALIHHPVTLAKIILVLFPLLLLLLELLAIGLMQFLMALTSLG